MPPLKTYHVFISHAWEYSDDYYRFVKLLNEAKNFKWKNYSVPEHDPIADDEDLKEELQNQINPVHIVVILSGMYTNYSNWIGFEMDYADEKSKPMIGVVPWGQTRIPQEVQSRVKEMVRWNTDSFVSAIRKHAL